MALISCPKCGNTVSEYAETCPNCGHPIQKERKTRRVSRLWIAGLAAAAAAAGALIVFSGLKFAGKKTAVEKPAAIPGWMQWTSDQSATFALPTVFNATYNTPAAKRAREMLEERPTSRSVIIQQLRNEGFGTVESVYALVNNGFDWNEQAARRARLLLETGSYTREELYDRLIELKFTGEEAEYGVTHCGKDWDSLEI